MATTGYNYVTPKPAFGQARLIGHSLQRGLVFCCLANEGGGNALTELLSSYKGAYTFTGANPFSGSGSGSGGGQFFDSSLLGSTSGANYSTSLSAAADLHLSANGFSMAVRVKPASTFSTSGGLGRQNDGNTVNAGWEIFCQTGGTGLTIVRSSVDYDAKTTAALTTGLWQTVILTWSGSFGAAAVIYYDGVSQSVTLTGTGGSGTAGSAATKDFVLCNANFNHNSLGAGPFTGLIDYGYFWNRVITASEINLIQADPFCLFASPILTAGRIYAQGVRRARFRAVTAVAATNTFPSLWLAGLAN